MPQVPVDTTRVVCGAAGVSDPRPASLRPATTVRFPLPSTHEYSGNGWSVKSGKTFARLVESAPWRRSTGARTSR